MSKTTYYAVHDAKAGIYGVPFPQAGDKVAIRGFTEASLNPETELNKYPTDFSIFRVGYYDDETGLFTAEAPPEFLATAQNCINHAEKEQLEQQIRNKQVLKDLLAKHTELTTQVNEANEQLETKLEAIKTKLGELDNETTEQE